MSKERIVVRAILHDEDNRILLAKRVKKGSEHGKYALIGGTVEEETLEEAIIREVKEETGLELKNPTYIRELVDESSVKGETWRVCYFSGLVKGELRLKQDEVTEGKFFSKADIKDVEIGFDHRERIMEFWESL